MAHIACWIALFVAVQPVGQVNCVTARAAINFILCMQIETQIFIYFACEVSLDLSGLVSDLLDSFLPCIPRLTELVAVWCTLCSCAGRVALPDGFGQAKESTKTDSSPKLPATGGRFPLIFWSPGPQRIFQFKAEHHLFHYMYAH
jgi:hypothetical protein